jgi:spermidine synthase
MNEAATRAAPASGASDRRSLVLVCAVLVAAVSGLIYELVAGALSSYLIGDSVTQFSLIIGLFLSSMGLGAWASKLVERDLVRWLVAVELGVGLVGGTGALLGFLAFAYTSLYQVVLFGSIVGVGILVGLEIPLVLRLLKERDELRVTVANILAADYIGALLASVLFPFLLLPHLGLVRAGLLAGLANVAVAMVLSATLRTERPLLRLRIAGGLSAAGLAALFLLAGELTSLVEDVLYRDNIVVAENTRYQRVVITRYKDDVRLFLNGHLQFSSIDEHRYHEALVHPAMSAAGRPQRVLILGGGDGLTAREVLKHASVDHIDLVDLDGAVTSLFAERPFLVDLNRGALKDPRVTVHNADAMRFLESSRQQWDVILMDLPDPSDTGLAKLYSTAFFKLCHRHLSRGGALATQATNPFRSRDAFWTIVRTIEASGGGELQATPYQNYLPTFGSWGYVLATRGPLDTSELQVSTDNKYLTNDVLPSLFVFPPDINRRGDTVSTLDNPQVVTLYQRGYSQYLD